MKILQLARLSLFKTLLINFKTQAFYDACHLPILIGKGVVIRQFGNIVIGNPRNTGSLSIGLQYTVMDHARNYGVIDNQGTLRIGGKVIIRTGVKIRIDRKASVYLGDHVKIGANNILIATKSIHFGEGTETSWNCQIIDSDMHYVKNISSGEIKDKTREILIAKNVWIGNHCKINKNAFISDNSIVASNSMVNKKFLQPNIIIAGSPAKMIAENYNRVFDQQEEYKLNVKFNHL